MPADLPTLAEARAYLRREGHEMIACYAPATNDPDDQHCVHGWAVRRLSRRRSFRSGAARPAAATGSYRLAHYEVVCRADDDLGWAAELAAAIVVVAERDARVCDDRRAEWQASIERGKRDAGDPKVTEQIEHWAGRAADLRAVADDLRRNYLTA